jgi:hypothetical protein|tara:strand:+ start:465 stop:815 length:351 start_codon:yes stop_codon:yes gene_type:complete
MPVVLQLRVHEKDLDLNPNVWYIQTVHEKQNLSERNIITIRHKKSLTTHWSDLNLDENSEKILEDVNKIVSLLTSRGIIVLPLEKVTGALAEMEEHCPRTKEFLEKQVERLMKYGY